MTIRAPHMTAAEQCAFILANNAPSILPMALRFGLAMRALRSKLSLKTPAIVGLDAQGATEFRSYWNQMVLELL